MRRVISAMMLLTFVACGGRGSSTLPPPASPIQPTLPEVRAVLNLVNYGVTADVTGSVYAYTISFSVQNVGNTTARITSVVVRLTLPNMEVTTTLSPIDLFGTTTIAPGASIRRANVGLVRARDEGSASSIGVTVTYTDGVGIASVNLSTEVPPIRRASLE